MRATSCMLLTLHKVAFSNECQQAYNDESIKCTKKEDLLKPTNKTCLMHTHSAGRMKEFFSINSSYFSEAIPKMEIRLLQKDSIKT